MRGSAGILLSLTAFLLLVPAPALAQTETARTFLLVAQPDMLDPHFSRTVVLGMHPEDSGPLGVILNRPTNHQLRELHPEHAQLTGRAALVFFGGPAHPDARCSALPAAGERPWGRG